MLSPKHVGLLGFLPILIGLRKPISLWRPEQDAEGGSKRGRGILAVAAITVVNGGDNIAVYTSVFAVRTAPDLFTIAAVFAAMTALWLAFSHWLVHHPQLGASRVFTTDQDLAIQHAALAAAGCAEIRAEKVSGARAEANSTRCSPSCERATASW